MKKKVLFIINDLRMGGAQRVLSIVMRELSRSGHDVSLITNHTGATDFYPLDSSILRFSTCLFSPSNNFFQAVSSNLKRIRRIRKVISDESPDVIFSFMTETNILVILASLFSGKRIIVSERSDPAKDTKSFVWEILRKITYRNANIVTTNSKGAIDYLSSMVRKEKLVYLPNPVDGCEQAGAVTKVNDAENVMLVVARLHPAKGIDILIDAMAILMAKNKYYQLWVAGDGAEKEKLQSQAKSQGVWDQIQWLGAISDLTPLYQSASLFVLPSRREGMPNAMLEAMSCGLPVIVSNASPGPLEYIVDGESGRVFEAGSSRCLADAIEDVMDNEEKRIGMGKVSRQRVKPLLCSNILPEWEKILFPDQEDGRSTFVR